MTKLHSAKHALCANQKQRSAGRARLAPVALVLVRQRTASINAVRGLVGEFGLIAAKGRCRMFELRQRMNAMTPDQLPAVACQAINTLFDHIDILEEQIAAVEQQIIKWHKSNEGSLRLATAPGVGPITASAIVAAVGDGRQFQSARHFAAWLGFTPRMHAIGKKSESEGSAKEATDICGRF